MTGQEYEERCARRLRRCGFGRVTLTKGSGDQGVDILARRKGERYAIQCKYYARPVGNRAVQEAFAGAKYYGCDRAVVLTNSTFTAAAEELADSTGVLLWEGDDLPYPPCRSLLIRWMGILIAIAAGVTLTVLHLLARPSPVETACLAALITGGLLSALESGLFGLDLAACLCWLTAAALARFDLPLAWLLPPHAALWPLIPFGASLLRGLRLYLLYRAGRREDLAEDPEEDPEEEA